MEEKKYRCFAPECSSQGIFPGGLIPASRRLRFVFGRGEKTWEVFKCPYCRGRLEEVREPKELSEMKRRLHAGEQVFVLYNNPDNDIFGIEWEFNVLKLVPKGDGRYSRFWRDEENKGWESHGEYDVDAEIERMNPWVHDRIFGSEEEAIEYIGRLWDEERRDGKGAV